MSELIINDDNYLRFIEPPSPEFSKGLIPRDWDQMLYGSFEYAAPFNIPLIPREEWPDRIADMERSKTRLSRSAPLRTSSMVVSSCWMRRPRQPPRPW